MDQRLGEGGPPTIPPNQNQLPANITLTSEQFLLLIRQAQRNGASQAANLQASTQQPGAQQQVSQIVASQQPSSIQGAPQPPSSALQPPPHPPPSVPPPAPPRPPPVPQPAAKAAKKRARSTTSTEADPENKKKRKKLGTDDEDDEAGGSGWPDSQRLVLLDTVASQLQTSGKTFRSNAMDGAKIDWANVARYALLCSVNCLHVDGRDTQRGGLQLGLAGLQRVGWRLLGGEWAGLR